MRPSLTPRRLAYRCPVKDAKALGLRDPRVGKDELRRAYIQKAKAAHPDAGGSTAAFQSLQRAHDRLLEFQRERAAGALRERRYQSRMHAKTDFADRITHALSRPLGNLVSTKTKLRSRAQRLVPVIQARRRESPSA